MTLIIFQEISTFSKPIWNRKRGKTDVRVYSVHTVHNVLYSVHQHRLAILDFLFLSCLSWGQSIDAAWRKRQHCRFGTFYALNIQHVYSTNLSYDVSTFKLKTHRRRIKTEEKAKVVAAVGGGGFIQFLSKLAFLPRTILKNRMHSSLSFKSSW